MNAYVDNSAYFHYLLEHCTSDIPAQGQGRLAGAAQLISFLDRMDLRSEHLTLEVGCGTGRVLRFLAARYGIQPHGIDPCREAIDYVHNHHSDWADRVKYTPDGALTELERQFFDRILFWGVFELTDQVRTLIELSRIAKPGARILLNGVRNADYLEDDVEMAAAVDAYREKKIPIMLTRIDRLEAVMKSLGFEIDHRFIFMRKEDVARDSWSEDRDAKRFAEATYIVSKEQPHPADFEVASTAY